MVRSLQHSHASDSSSTTETGEQRSTARNRGSNAAIQEDTGLGGGSGISDAEAESWLDEEGAAPGGEAEVDVVGKDPLPPEDPPSDGGGAPPPTDVAAGLEPHATEAAAVESAATLAVADLGAEGGPVPDLPDGLAEMAGETRTSIEAEMARYREEEAALIANATTRMSPQEKRDLLAEMGYPAKSIGKMSPQEIDRAISGTLEQQALQMRIQGMTPEELAALPMGEKRRFLEGLGIPSKDLGKAKDKDVSAAFHDVVNRSKIPGNHKIKLKIKGGFFSRKSYDISLNVTQEGGLEGVDVKKKGGFFSKLGSVVKMALPVIAKVLAPMTGGLSLLALGIYEGIKAIKNKDWLGAIGAVAGGVGGLAAKGLARTAEVARKVADVASSAKAGLAAARAKSPGGLLAALSTGAGAVAGFAADKSGKFASTLERWSEKLDGWSQYAKGGEAVVHSIKGRDPLGAVDAALGTLSLATGEGSATTENLERAQRITRYSSAAQEAIRSKPPRYAGLVDSMMGVASELKQSGRLDAAQRITGRSAVLEAAVAKGDPQAIAEAMVGLSEAIELAKAGEDGATAVTERYRRTSAVISSSVGVVQAVRTGRWEDAVSASSSLVEELSGDGLLDDAARITRKSTELSAAIRSGDASWIEAAARDLGSDVQAVWAEVKARREAGGAVDIDLDEGMDMPVLVLASQTMGSTSTSGRYFVNSNDARIRLPPDFKVTGTQIPFGTPVDLIEISADKKYGLVRHVGGNGEWWTALSNLRAVTRPLSNDQINEGALRIAINAAIAKAPRELQAHARTSIPEILRNAARLGVENPDQVAYMLATAQHESRLGGSMTESHNRFKYDEKTKKWTSKDHVRGREVSADSEEELETAYWESAYGGRLGNQEDTTDARDFRGRGFAQITGRANYEKMSRVLNAQGFSYTIDGRTWGGRGNPPIDLAAHPDHVSRVPSLAARLLGEGSIQGHYTGSSLDDHINDRSTNFVNARSVINGDRNKKEEGQTKTNGQRIADIAALYAEALKTTWPAVFQPADRTVRA